MRWRTQAGSASQAASPFPAVCRPKSSQGLESPDTNSHDQNTYLVNTKSTIEVPEEHFETPSTTCTTSLPSNYSPRHHAISDRTRASSIGVARLPISMAYVPGLTLPASIFSNTPISILLPLGLGLGSGLVSQPGRLKPKKFSDHAAKERGTFRSTEEQYLALKQPPLRPPPWVFAPAWTTLYLLMGYAANRAWNTGMASLNPTVVENTRRGATLYTIQLGLNIVWMPLFFGMGRPIEALLDIVALTGTVGYLSYVWSKVDQTAAYCLAPYLAWLGFATYLTAGTGYLNGWTLKGNEETQEAEVKKEL